MTSQKCAEAWCKGGEGISEFLTYVYFFSLPTLTIIFLILLAIWIVKK